MLENRGFIDSHPSKGIVPPTNGLTIQNGETIENFGDIFISPPTARCIRCSGNSSVLQLTSGTIECQTPFITFEGLLINSGGVINIDAGAVLALTGNISTNLVNISLGGNLNCNGVLKVGD